MIGQKNLQSTIVDLTKNNKYPRFTILVGQYGSGRKLLSKFIVDQLNAECAFVDISVDNVRHIVSESYKISMPIVYVLADADRMSPAAKNALLKITEEPPRNAYFILTLNNLYNTLATIRSRGTVFYMESYTVDEIDCYYHDCFSSYDDVRAIVNEVCETPGEVNLLVENDPAGLKEFVDKVIENVAEVSTSNALKIGNFIKFKDTENGKYDLMLFWKIFMCKCSKHLQEAPMHYVSGIKITSKYLQELRITGINKRSAFDMWLLDLRKEWIQ